MTMFSMFSKQKSQNKNDKQKKDGAGNISGMMENPEAYIIG